MLPGMLKGERIASLSEAQAQSQDSYLKIRERFAKGPRKIRERLRRPSKPPPSIASHGRRHSFCNWVLEFRAWVTSNPTSPFRHALCLKGSVLGVEGMGQEFF